MICWISDFISVQLVAPEQMLKIFKCVEYMSSHFACVQAKQFTAILEYLSSSYSDGNTVIGICAKNTVRWFSP